MALTSDAWQGSEKASETLASKILSNKPVWP